MHIEHRAVKRRSQTLTHKQEWRLASRMIALLQCYRECAGASNTKSVNIWWIYEQKYDLSLFGLTMYFLHISVTRQLKLQSEFCSSYILLLLLPLLLLLTCRASVCRGLNSENCEIDNILMQVVSSNHALLWTTKNDKGKALNANTNCSISLYKLYFTNYLLVSGQVSASNRRRDIIETALARNILSFRITNILVSQLITKICVS